MFNCIGWLQISEQSDGLVVSLSDHVQNIFFVTKQSASNQVFFLLRGCKFLLVHRGTSDRLCGLVVRVSGYRYRGLGFDSRRYQIF